MPPAQQLAHRRGYKFSEDQSYDLHSNQYEGGRASARSAASDDEKKWEDDPPEQPGSNYRTPKERIYFADWTRALAIQLVIFVHCLVNSADASGFDPDENPGAQQKKDGIIKCLVQIGIPMFFYISGMGATFFNTEGKGFGNFVGNKTLRLMVPFVAAIFIFLIPRLYFGQSYEDFCKPDGKNVEEDYWTFQMKTLPTIGSKLSWLWYLPALFIDCMLTYPLLAWTVRRSRKIPFDQRDDGNIVFLQLTIFVIWCYPCFYMDTGNNYGIRYLLPSNLTLACIIFFFYTFQLLIYTEGGDKYALLIKIIGPLGSMALNYWKDQAPNQPLHHVLMMINYDAIFFSQGCVDQLYFKAMMRQRNKASKTVWAPLCVLFAILLYALSSPTVYSQTGFLFFYPLYSDYTIQCLYTTGTWMWIYITAWLMQYVANKKFNETAYKFLAGSSLYAYLSHYFFIILIAVGIVRPYKIEFIPALFLEVFATNACILISYSILNFFYELVMPSKSKDKAAGTPEEQAALLKNQEVMVEAKNQ